MENTYICHYGVGHLKGGNSGRYPWGSGRNSGRFKNKTSNKNYTHTKSSDKTTKQYTYHKASTSGSNSSSESDSSTVNESTMSSKDEKWYKKYTSSNKTNEKPGETKSSKQSNIDAAMAEFDKASADRVKKSAAAGTELYKNTTSAILDAISIKGKHDTNKFINTALKEMSDDELNKIVRRLTLENNYIRLKGERSKYKVHLYDVLKLADSITNVASSAKKWKSITFD